MAEEQMEGPKVSVIITTWNGRDILRDCLRALIRMTEGITREMIVVDDASTDGSAAMISTEFPSVHLVSRTVNGGFVRANNDGVTYARGTYIFLLNSDTVVANNAVGILAAYLDAHPNVGVCGGLLLNSDGSTQVSFGNEPSFHQAFVDAFFLNDLFPGAGFPNRGIRPRAHMTSPIAVQYVTGADLMIRRALVNQLGLFDERFEAYCEEVDLCRRVRRAANAEVHFVPEARIFHLGGFSYSRQGEKHARTLYSSYDKYLVKHYGTLYARIVRGLYAWHYAVKGVFRAIRWLVAPAAAQEAWRKAALDAWFCVRYALRPGEN